MSCCYAIYPDTESTPTAVFSELEDAMEWGVERYGDDKFKIAYLPLVKVERGERSGGPAAI